jgi:ubiquinone/menaquinone biosynthesis C-methylase UbiE
MEQKKAAVKSFYENTQTYLGQDYNIRIRTEVVKDFLANYSEFSNVLDMPCGNGMISLQNAEKFKHLTLVDFSENMIKETRQNAEKLSITNIKTLCSDIFNTQFQDHSFDLVISLGIFAHIDNPQQLVAELLRITKPGGLLIIQNTASDHFYGQFIHLYQWLKRKTGKTSYALNKIPRKWLENEFGKSTQLINRYDYNQSFLGFSKFFSNEKKYAFTKNLFGDAKNNKNRWLGSDTIYLFQKN